MTDDTTSRDIEALERTNRARNRQTLPKKDDPAEIPSITPDQRKPSGDE